MPTDVTRHREHLLSALEADLIGPDHDDEDGASADAGPKRRHFLPASLGLSVLLPPAAEAGEADTVRATVRWADYVAEDYVAEDCDVEDHEVEVPESGKAKAKRFWRRKPRSPVSVDLALDHRALARDTELEGADGVWLTGRLAEGSARGLAPGTRALSLFVVKRRGPGEKGKADERFLFQVRLALAYAPGFAPRPNWRGEWWS